MRDLQWFSSNSHRRFQRVFFLLPPYVYKWYAELPALGGSPCGRKTNKYISWASVWYQAFLEIFWSTISSLIFAMSFGWLVWVTSLESENECVFKCCSNLSFKLSMKLQNLQECGFSTWSIKCSVKFWQLAKGRLHNLQIKEISDWPVSVFKYWKLCFWN